MAIFQFNNQSLPYQIGLAPIAHDLLLLQSSKFSADYWKPVLEDFSEETPAGGRVITCESPLPDAVTLERFLRTLGLQGTHVVAFDDAAELVKEVSKIEAASFAKTLFLPQGGIKGGGLAQKVREFCGI